MNFYFFILNTFGGLTLVITCTHFFGVGAISTYIDSRTKKGLRHLSTLGAVKNAYANRPAHQNTT